MYHNHYHNKASVLLPIRYDTTYNDASFVVISKYNKISLFGIKFLFETIITLSDALYSMLHSQPFF